MIHISILGHLLHDAHCYGLVSAVSDWGATFLPVLKPVSSNLIYAKMNHGSVIVAKASRVRRRGCPLAMDN